MISLIRTTPAMSLLYECINGIIQGGILEGADGIHEGDEIATLCVSKLRGMVMIEGDPNCETLPKFPLRSRTDFDLVRYVALLAFNKIVISHPHLVSQQEDVIMSCIDDSDISIRMQALDLGAGMVCSENLETVVERLMLQLRSALALSDSIRNDRLYSLSVELAADSDGEDPEATLRSPRKNMVDPPELPLEFKVTVIRQILDMCCKDMYANVADFDWYIEILLQLVKLVPSTISMQRNSHDDSTFSTYEIQDRREEDVACTIGWELRNVAVRVASVREKVVSAANKLVLTLGADPSFTAIGAGGRGVLSYAAWIVGEFATSLKSGHETLSSMIHQRVWSLPPQTIIAYLQSIPKVFVSIVSDEDDSWGTETKTRISLLLARVIQFLEPLASHPNLEVQERSVEFVELMRIAFQAVGSHEKDSSNAPLLLSKAIPTLFTGTDLNPVAPDAQKKVPLPHGMDLDFPLHGNLLNLLQFIEKKNSAEAESTDFKRFYNNRFDYASNNKSVSKTINPQEPLFVSYQQTEDHAMDPNLHTTKRIEFRGRNKDDPFYITDDNISSGTSTPFHEILKYGNGDHVDIDSIPIMDLDLGDNEQMGNMLKLKALKEGKNHPRLFHIAIDENIESDALATNEDDVGMEKVSVGSNPSTRKSERTKKSPLEVDSSGLVRFSINSAGIQTGQLEAERRVFENADMAKALKDIERLRLEMQRAAERTQASEDIPLEGTLIKKRRKKKKPIQQENESHGGY